MTTASTLADQLAALGIQLHPWPPEPTGGFEDGWIQRGQAYANGLRLWRAQLRNAFAAERAARDLLQRTVQEAARLSSWHQAAITYLLSDLEAPSRHQRVQAAARLVAAEDRTPAQLLGAALDLAGHQLEASAAHGLKRLLAHPSAAPQQALELCALLVEALGLPTDSEADLHPAVGHQQWLRVIDQQLIATALLQAAVELASGAATAEPLLAQLDNLARCATAGDLEHDGSQEHEAIQAVQAREQRLHRQGRTRPVIRTVHHFACTGGTVICKCLAAMPGVALISEVNPLNRFGSSFEPTNPLLLFERNYRQLSTEEIRDDFLRQMAHIAEICGRDGVDLVLRDHSHTDFCRGLTASTLCPIVDYLSDDYDLLSVLTVRHPLDSYLGLRAQKWHKHFSPCTLEEYCSRYHIFLDRYRGMPIWRYEDFCQNPFDFMRDLCALLEVNFSPSFMNRFGDFSLTGDSGRRATDLIELRPRRPIPEEVATEMSVSPAYHHLLDRLGYNR
jgi:hypothetical protein